MFKKSLLVALMVVVMLSGFSFAADAKKPDERTRTGRRGGNRERWPLAVQAYSFRNFSLFEAIEKAQEAGLKFLEAYPNQIISKEIIAEDGKPVKLWFNISPEIKQQIKDKLKKHDVRMINFGVTWLSSKEPELRQAFDFAKEMGIRTLICEPDIDNMPLIDKLANEYKIKVGIHNHPNPSKYWNPDTVLKALEGRSRMVGATADTGHWCRSGLDPVEQIKKLNGRIVSLHLKDLKDFGTKKTHDVPYGTGTSKVKEVLEELNKQGFRGVFSIEYEHNWNDSVPEIKECVAFFNKTKAELKPVRSEREPRGDRQKTDNDKKQPNNADKAEKK
ncbi:MAG: sugar phosphate isomerase/epimerase [Phycisphaerae bacterium]|nr:sugar phosphate isomerase/epimerase [Phycisphaerae bacterium]